MFNFIPNRITARVMIDSRKYATMKEKNGVRITDTDHALVDVFKEINAFTEEFETLKKTTPIEALMEKARAYIDILNSELLKMAVYDISYPVVDSKGLVITDCGEEEFNFSKLLTDKELENMWIYWEICKLRENLTSMLIELERETARV